MKPWIAMICLAVCLPAVGADKAEPGNGWGARKSFQDVEFWGSVLDDPSRDEWQRPIEILDLLGIVPGDVVADLGAGTGYFVRFLSFPIGDSGRLYAVDTEQAMIDYLDAMQHTHKDRVVTVLAERDDPKLPPGEIDLVFIANTWRLIKKRPAYLERLVESLSPEGRVVVVGFHEGDLPVGPKKKKVGRDRVIEEFEASGWRFVAESVMLRYQYFLTFLPPPRDVVRPVPTPLPE